MNIAVAQSGGPTCAINASLLGVFKGAIRSDKIDIVFGSLNGIEGIINDDLNKVTLLIDKDLMNNKLLFHPNVNTKTMSITYDDLIKFIEYENHKYR